MFAEDDVVENATDAENIADGLRLGRHVFYVYDLGGHVAGSSASDEEVVRVIGHRCQTEIDYYWLFAQNYVVRFQISMDYVFPGHLGETSEYTLQNEFPLADCVFGKIVEPSADGVAFDVLKCKIDGIVGLVDSFELHEVGVVEELGDSDLIDESLFSILLGKGGLFTKSFYGNSFLIAETDSQINCCKITFAQSFLGFEKIVEIVLVHEVFEFVLPLLDILDVVAEELLGLEIGAYEFEAEGGA